jgi:hypothetical protein
MTKNFTKFTAKKSNLLIKKLQFAYLQPFSPQKGSSGTSIHEISQLFFVEGNFCPPGSGSALPMRTRIQPTKINADPKHCLQVFYLSSFLIGSRLSHLVVFRIIFHVLRITEDGML